MFWYVQPIGHQLLIGEGPTYGYRRITASDAANEARRMTGSGFAIAKSIVFILMLFCPRNAQTRNKILPFLPPTPESDFGFRISGWRRAVSTVNLKI